MRIGIDLDGVIFDSEEICGVYAELYDCLTLKRNSIIKNGEPRVQERYNWNEEEENYYMSEYADTENFGFVAGAKEVLELLKKDGHELIVITARGYTKTSDKNKKIAENKLKEFDFKFDKIHWKATDKVKVCKEEKIDIMIDDNYHTCEALSSVGIKSLYFHSLLRRHITNDENVFEVSHWGEIYRYFWNLKKDK